MKTLFKYLLLLLFFYKPLVAQENNLYQANELFNEGKFLESVDLASKINTIDAKIFCARTLAIYGHFILEGDAAIDVFMQARKFSEEALDIDMLNDAAHVEAAHTMGRYSQLIGVVTALKEGFAEKIAYHLDEAIKINSENVNAQIAKGSWHSEIVDKAGFMANILYGATSAEARIHYENAINLNSEEVGVLYEVAYGYSLLGKKKDIILAKEFLLKINNMESKNYLDNLYKEKAKELLSDL